MSAERIEVSVDPSLEALVPVFLENRREDLVRIARALAPVDFKALRMVGHNMKGAGGAYGFEVISKLGASMERAALAGDEAAVREAARELESYLARVQVRFGP